MSLDKSNETEEMLPEYDFSGGKRGVFAQEYAEGTNIRVISPDLAEVFPDSAAVNEALRALLEAARHSVKINGADAL